MVAVLLSTATSIYLTGALHEDGFVDVCVGFGGAKQALQVLQMMHDSRIGVYGALGIALLLAAKIASRAYLSSAQVMPALLLAHPLSRCLAVALIWRMNYICEAGKAKPLAQQMS